jgi:small subunit ribosomal protein S18
VGRKSKAAPPRNERKGRDAGKKFKKKVCVFCKEGATWIDYKDVNLLRRFMSDRAKIRARRVSGNCAQHQRDIAMAIKTARELALLPYATRVTSSRGGGRGGPGGGRGRDGGGERGPRPDRDAVAAEPSYEEVAAVYNEGDTDEPALVGGGDAEATEDEE